MCSDIKKGLPDSLGDRIEFVCKDGKNLVTELLNIKRDGGSKISDVIVIASNDTVDRYSGEFDHFKDDNGRNPFIARIDSSIIEEDMTVVGVEVCTTEIMEMISLTLELAVSGRNLLRSNLPMVESYDAASRVIQFIPGIKRVNYEECIDKYKRELKALQAA